VNLLRGAYQMDDFAKYWAVSRIGWISVVWSSWVDDFEQFGWICLGRISSVACSLEVLGEFLVGILVGLHAPPEYDESDRR
jgi:hypothetical protein